MLGGFVPSLVAVLLTWQREGTSGLKQLGRRGIQFKIGGRWYLTMMALVILATLGHILIIQILGYPFDFNLFLVQAGSFPPLIIIGPISEEFGWRGYALDRWKSEAYENTIDPASSVAPETSADMEDLYQTIISSWNF